VAHIDGPPGRPPRPLIARLTGLFGGGARKPPLAEATADFEDRLTALAAEITAAYVAGNKTPADAIPGIFRTVREGLAELQQAPDEAPAPAEATAPVIDTAPASPAAPAVVDAAVVRPVPPHRAAWMAFDRAAVLLIGVAVGGMIGAAFITQNGGLAPAAKAPTAVVARPPPPPQQTAGLDCPVPFPPHLLQTLAAGQPITVGVFGDSFGDGVWAALYHLLPKDYHVLRFSKESTGFTRYASLNLEDAERSQIAGQPVDIAVIDFGANDTQGIYDGGHAWPLLSDGWKRVYGARMDRFVGALRDQGAMVYWVGLPIMRKPEFDSQISDMLAFYDARMTALGVPYIDVKALSEDANGAFNDYLPVAGSAEPRLMRANDGIHMTMAGYERIAQPVATRIQDYVTHARRFLQIDAPPPAPAVSAAQAAPSHAL
jgi:lysophospholipase L1-like esterase